MVLVLLQPFPFSPDLFCSTSLLFWTYFIQVERMVEVDQAESCKPSCLRRSTVLLPPQPFFAFTHSTEQATLSSKFRLSLKRARITLISVMPLWSVPSDPTLPWKNPAISRGGSVDYGLKSMCGTEWNLFEIMQDRNKGFWSINRRTKPLRGRLSISSFLAK
jgi:hypothetical protein